MPVRLPPSRTGLSPAERALRSKLNQLLASAGLIRGTLLYRRRRCGNPRCHCARGPGHPGVYLVQSQGPRQRQRFVPAAWQERIEQWVENHRRVRELLDQLSELHWQRLENRQD